MGKTTVYKYVINELIAIDVPKDTIKNIASIILYLGLGNFDILDFEMYFPEQANDIDKLITFISTEECHPLIIKTVMYHNRIEENYRRKPHGILLSDEYDKNDYERAQNPNEIGFHM